MLYDTLCEVAPQALPNSGLKKGDTLTTYVEVAEQAGRIATGLLERGIEKGQPIGIIMANGPDLLILAYALFALGAIPVPLNSLAPRAELAMTARKAHVRGVIAAPQSVEVAANVIADLGGAGKFPLFVTGDNGRDSIGEITAKTIGKLPKIGPDDAALYMFSSGSTGIPKVVPHTHGELDIDSRNARRRGFTLPDDTQINMMPGSHAMGFLSALYLAVTGSTTYYWSDPQPFALSRGRFAQAIADNRVTLLMGVPFMFDALAAIKDDLDFSGLRMAQSGAIALRGETYRNFRDRFGVKIRQGYGSTECLAISYNNLPDPDTCYDSVGPLVDGVEVKIVPAENPFGPEYGEVVARAPWVTKGYLDAPETNASTIRDGWFHTGDLGGFGKDGCLYIKGRLKLLIEVAGHKVDPFEIEEVLLAHPAVAEVAVVGVPDARTKEQRLKAFIVAKETAAPEAIIRYCRERLSSEKVPSAVEFLEALPKSAAGKVLRGKLMEAV